MSAHLHRALEDLKRRVLSLSSIVEESVYKAAKAVDTRDAELAQAVKDGDAQIDTLEVELEEECLKVLALHQPVATDLRFIVSVLKINNDLERIGDLAVNMANRARALSELVSLPATQVDFQGAEQKVQRMLKLALQSLIHMDAGMAGEVCASDDEIDNINRDIHKQVIQKIKNYPEELERLMLYLSVSKNLERIADHATNIAEDVQYMITGNIVRHGRGRLF